MRIFSLWLAGTVVLAVILHLSIILGSPLIAVDGAMERLSVNGTINAALHHPRPSAHLHGPALPDPDVLISSCVFDLSDGPLRVTTPVAGLTWSLAFHGDNADPFFFLNDLQADDDYVELVLALEDQKVAPNARPRKVPVIISPVPRGLILFRTLLKSEGDLQQTEQERRQARCKPI